MVAKWTFIGCFLSWTDLVEKHKKTFSVRIFKALLLYEFKASFHFVHRNIVLLIGMKYVVIIFSQCSQAKGFFSSMGYFMKFQVITSFEKDNSWKWMFENPSTESRHAFFVHKSEIRRNILQHLMKEWIELFYWTLTYFSILCQACLFIERYAFL